MDRSKGKPEVPSLLRLLVRVRLSLHLATYNHLGHGDRPTTVALSLLDARPQAAYLQMTAVHVHIHVLQSEPCASISYHERQPKLRHVTARLRESLRHPSALMSICASLDG